MKVVPAAIYKSEILFQENRIMVQCEYELVGALLEKRTNSVTTDKFNNQ